MSKFLRTLVYILFITFTLGIPPTIAMNDEEIYLPASHYSKFSPTRVNLPTPTLTHTILREEAPLVSSSMKKESSLVNSWEAHKTESHRLKQSIKHIEPKCGQIVQYIHQNSRWASWKLDEPYYDISDYTSGCGTCCSIFCCCFSTFCCFFCNCYSIEEYGGCYFYDDDLMCFAWSNYKDKDPDGEGKVMTRRDALRVMEVVNREKFEHYSNNPEERVEISEMWKSATIKPTSFNFDGSLHYTAVPKGKVSYHTVRSKMVIEYERKLKAKGMHFVAHDLDSKSDSDSDS